MLVVPLIPAALHLVVIGKKQGLWLWIEDIFLLILFFVIMIVCTYCSVEDMINKLNNS